MTDEPGEEMMSVQDAAIRLGIGKNSAYKAVADGAIPSVRVGGRVLIPVAAFNKMLDVPIPAQPQYKPGDPRSLKMYRRFTDEEDEIITKDYLNYVPTADIAEKVNRSDGVIKQRILKLGLRRSSTVTRLMAWAPEHLRDSIADMGPDRWIAEVYAWKARAREEASAARGAEAERMYAEIRKQAHEIDARTDLKRNDKMKAKRMIGMTLEDIGHSYGITRERVRQLTDPTFVPSIPTHSPLERLQRLEARSARERERIMGDAAQRLFDLYRATPPEAQTKFLAMIEAATDTDE